MRILFCGVGAIGSTVAGLCRNLDATLGVRLTRDNVEALCGGADLLVDCFDNRESRQVLSDYARRAAEALVHGALAGDGSFGLVCWDERFVPDPEDQAGQATCEGGIHLPLIGLLGASLARIIQDFVKHGMQRDVLVNLTAVTPTTSS
jgi:hypothetical protein